MKVKVLETCGMEWALLGLSLSYNKLDPDKDIMKLYDLSKKLAKKDGGHNKFLESIITWIDITASRKWWSQFDTYRVGVTKQSESTMHTLLRDEITQDHFNSRVKTEYIEWLNHLREDGDIGRLKDALPEGFLQRRIICTNYKTLRTIYQQRKHHKLGEWRDFLKMLIAVLPTSGYIDGNYETSNRKNN